MSSAYSLKSFWISLGVLFLVTVGYYCNVLLKTDGHYVYFLDDAYIHLAIAKNFAFHDVWGVTPYQFSSTSSAPLFTLLISYLIEIFGNSDQLPLYFNIVFGIGIVYFLNKYYSDFLDKTQQLVLATVFTLFFAVLHMQILSGMEHVFQVFLFVINIYCFQNLEKNKKFLLGFYLSIFLMGTVRFESMFYFVILAFVLALIRKWRMSVAVLIFGFIPIAIFCYLNYQQNGFLFPNSVLVKGTKLSLDSTFFLQLKKIVFDNFLLNISFYKIGFFPILICLYFIYIDFKTKKWREVIKNNFLLIVLLLVMICHAMFADLKGSFRYEAYILVGFSMALIPKLKNFFIDFKTFIKNERFLSVLVLMNVFLLFYKLWSAHLVLNDGGKNIYEQQMQSAKFLHTYYSTSKVVANDIGAITYYTDIHLMDIAGLGSVETIVFNENKKTFDDQFESFLTEYCDKNQYDIAVVYESWLQGHVPKNWRKAATLKIKDKITAAQGKVSIYSIDTNNLQSLKSNIKQFNWNKNIQVTILN